MKVLKQKIASGHWIRIPLFSVLISFVFTGCNLIGGSGPSGVLKTVDNGTTWQLSNAIRNSQSNISGLNVTKIYIDPKNNADVYLSSTNNGLWQSEDNGQSWEQILNKISAYGFYVDPNNSSDIFVSGIFASHGKIVRSTDSGKTWDSAYNEASVNNPVVAIAGNPDKQGEIYAALSSGQLIKSLDNGANWFIIYDFKTPIRDIQYSKVNGGLYVLLRTAGVAESTDGGNNWTYITSKLTKVYANINSYVPAGFSSFEKMAIDGSSRGVVFLTTSNGLFKTTDNGRNWDFINLPIRRTEDLPRAIAESKGGMIAYTSIGNTIYQSDDSGQSWATQVIPSSAEVNAIAIDPVLSQAAYAGLGSK